MLTGWANSYKLTIDSSKVDSDLTNFPVNITLSSGSGISNFDVADIFTELTPTTVESGTVLYLPMNGDKSSSQHTITSSGTPILHPATTFSGFNSLGYMEFDGSTEHLSTLDHADWDFSTGDWTVDFWIYRNGDQQDYAGLFSTLLNGVALGYSIGFGTVGGGNQNKLRIRSNASGSWGNDIVAANILPNTTWTHVAFVRDGNTLSIYLDGVEDNNVDCTGYNFVDESGGMVIGRHLIDLSNYYFDGFMTELHVSKGIARTATISGSAPPTSPYEPDSYTKLLLHFEGDQSDSDHAITFNGSSQIYSSVGKFGGSYYFNGTTDYLSLSDHNDWNLGSEDFTIEFWVWCQSGVNSCDFVGQYVDGNNRWKLYLANDSTLRFLVTTSGVNEVIYGDTGHGMANQTWHHLAVVKNGTSFNTYVDGNSVSSTTSSYTIPDLAAPLGVGYVGGYYSNIYMSELNILKGVAKYTTNFAVPQGPPGSSWDNRKKIAITDENDNRLYTEIERWDWVNEEANLWVKVPTISSGTDTTLYLYYDATQTTNSGYVGDTGDTAAKQVWDSNFVGVWHMAQDPNGDVADSIKDSTSQINHGTPSGTMTTGDLVDGKIGKALDFDGTDDYVSIPNQASALWDGDFCISAIVNTASVASGTGYILSAAATRNSEFRRYNNTIEYKMWDGATEHKVISEAILIDTVYYTAITRSKVDGLKLYFDGIEVDTNVFTGNAVARANSDNIGALYPGAGEFSGIIDEVHVSNTARSPEWVKATYYSNWDDLVTFGELITFVFSDPIPIDLSTVYGISKQLQLTTTVSGTDPSYVYDSTFYNAVGDIQIGSTASGINSGQYAAATMSTISGGVNYQWYVVATSSGASDTSDTYTFTNRFLCAGYVEDSGSPASGIPVRLYRRSTGELIGYDTSSGVSGTFSIPTDYNEYHYALAFYDTNDTNLAAADWLIPS